MLNARPPESLRQIEGNIGDQLSIGLADQADAIRMPFQFLLARLLKPEIDILRQYPEKPFDASNRLLRGAAADFVNGSPKFSAKLPV